MLSIVFNEIVLLFITSTSGQGYWNALIKTKQNYPSYKFDFLKLIIYIFVYE